MYEPNFFSLLPSIIAIVLAISKRLLSPPDKTIDFDFLTWCISNSFNRFSNIILCLALPIIMIVISYQTMRYWIKVRKVK